MAGFALASAWLGFDNYADDMTVTASASTVREISSALNEDCSRVSRWMCSNKLKLNPGKTHLMTVGTGQRLRHLTEKVNVSMDGVELQEDKEGCEFLLGVHVQSDLKWKKQVRGLVAKLSKRLTGLFKIKYATSFKIRKSVAEGVFNSVLVNCLPLFGGMDLGDLKEIQIMQNKAAQVVTNSPPRAERAPMFDKLEWHSVNQLIFYHSVLSVFKIRTNQEPEHLASILCKTSRNSRIMIPNFSLSLVCQSLSVRAV